jgi:hypothetical protein
MNMTMKMTMKEMMIIMKTTRDPGDDVEDKNPPRDYVINYLGRLQSSVGPRGSAACLLSPRLAFRGGGGARLVTSLILNLNFRGIF